MDIENTLNELKRELYEVANGDKKEELNYGYDEIFNKFLLNIEDALNGLGLGSQKVLNAVEEGFSRIKANNHRENIEKVCEKIADAVSESKDEKVFSDSDKYKTVQTVLEGFDELLEEIKATAIRVGYDTGKNIDRIEENFSEFKQYYQRQQDISLDDYFELIKRYAEDVVQEFNQRREGTLGKKLKEDLSNPFELPDEIKQKVEEISRAGQTKDGDKTEPKKLFEIDDRSPFV